MHERLSDVVEIASIRHDNTRCTVSYSRAPIPIQLLRDRAGERHMDRFGQHLRERTSLRATGPINGTGKGLTSPPLPSGWRSWYVEHDSEPSFARNARRARRRREVQVSEVRPNTSLALVVIPEDAVLKTATQE